jgi:putative nucleotidyltransferase-like protein
MNADADRLRHALRHPEVLPALTLGEWDLVVRQARRAGILARMAVRLDEAGLLDAVPAAPRHHLAGERTLAEKHRRDVHNEVRYISEALSTTGLPVILLKGAAYAVADLPPARGRLFSDIDILVPKASLGAVEQALHRQGWVGARIDPYDERYYRRWMHQIPPLTNRLRDTTLDVHHTIVPETVRLDLRADTLFAAARRVAGSSTLMTLAPADMILHSAIHLLNEGEYARGLRDLDDVTELLDHFGRDAGFWPLLLERAVELDLCRPLYYALRYAAALLGAPVPAAISGAARLQPPGTALRAVMDALFERALRPDHPSCRDGFSAPALWLLYVRSHHLRMPAHLLVPHLLRKAYMRTVKPPAAAP